MIKTITLDPCLEQRVKGKNIDEIQYDIHSVHMTSGGIGIKVSFYLQALDIASQALIMSGSNISGFIEKEFKQKSIPFTIVETPAENKVETILVDEKNEAHYIAENNKAVIIDDIQLMLFTSIIKEELNENDVIVFAYDENDISKEAMCIFYQTLYEQSEVRICELHPDYWSMLEHMSVNVLLVNEKQCLTYLHQERLPLSEMIQLIQKEIAPFAKIIIYTLRYNDFLLFLEGNIYRVVCNSKINNGQLFKEALLSGIIKCYVEDGDLLYLSEQCMSMSVVSAYSQGLSLPDVALLAQIKDEVMIYSI